MKTYFSFPNVLWCLAWNSVLIAIGLYLLVQGMRTTREIDLQTLQAELSEQKEYASKYAMPEKQAKAYVSSIEALEKHRDLLEEARDSQWSIGLIILSLSCLTEIGLIWTMFRPGNLKGGGAER